jgi:hypothetical protein
MTLDIPNELEAQWLISQGVSCRAMLEKPCLRASQVRFLENETFKFAEDGDRALVFRVFDCGTQVDLVAWSHRQKQLATWRGFAFALGQDNISNTATYFAGSALHVHRTPLDWLKADRFGICIVQPRFAYAHLGNVPRLICPDETHARELETWLQPPKPRAEILVEVAA